MRMVVSCLSLVLLLNTAGTVHAEPTKREVLTAIDKTVDFMMNDVSYKGGFVWQYSADLSERWGEIPCRDTQIWVQGATCEFGDFLLKAYHTTGDRKYLDYACRIADAIVWGQHPEGGWHYLIDFDMTGIRKYYKEVATRCLGWEEYYHYYGNCTFDDNTTAGATEYLLDVYMTTLDPKYRVPLLKALDFILEAQYPLGGWPQRYPLRYEHRKQGLNDYTSYYTFNDHVHGNNVRLLVKAWELLGNEAYLNAAKRGMDFYIASQYGNDKAAWGDQHYMDLRPAHARTYEPESLNARTTIWNINDLYYCYRVTGDKRYLEPIPKAIAWLESAIINTAPSKNYTHARYYEIGTNKPLYSHVVGTSVDDFYTHIRYEPSPGNPPGSLNIDIAALRSEYDTMSSMSPEDARATYTPNSRLTDRYAQISSDAAEKLLSTLDSRGMWIYDITISNYDNPYSGKPGRVIRGFRTATTISNLNTLLSYYARLD